jgi:hypothetical protein
MLKTNQVPHQKYFKTKCQLLKKIDHIFKLEQVGAIWKNSQIDKNIKKMKKK